MNDSPMIRAAIVTTVVFTVRECIWPLLLVLWRRYRGTTRKKIGNTAGTG